MYCSQCGGKLKDGAQFCIFCGQKIDNYTEYPILQEESLPKQFNDRLNYDHLINGRSEKRRLPWKAILSVIAGLIVVAFICFAFAGLSEYRKKSDVYNGKVNINELLSEYGLTRVFVVHSYHNEDGVNIARRVRDGYKPDMSRISTDKYSCYAKEYPIAYSFNGTKESERTTLESLRSLFSKTKNCILKNELETAITWLEYDLSGEKLTTIIDNDELQGEYYSCEINYNDDGFPYVIYTDNYNNRFSFDYEQGNRIVRYAYSDSQVPGNDFEYQYIYDDNNMISKIIEKSYYINDIERPVIYTHEWDKAGDGDDVLYQENIEYELDGINCKECYQYDTYGSIISYRSHQDDGSLDFYNEFEYEYDDNGNILKWRNVSTNNALYEAEYDNNGNLLSTTETYDDGTVGSQMRNEYEYDRLISCSADINYEKIYVRNDYNDDGRICRTEYGSLEEYESGEEYSDNIEIDYEYNTHGNISYETQYYNGELKKRSEYIYSNDNSP